MSRCSNYYDNVHDESFWSRLKTALLAAGSSLGRAKGRLDNPPPRRHDNTERRHFHR